MKEIFLLKLGEIVLKGQNRRAFEASSRAISAKELEDSENLMFI